MPDRTAPDERAALDERAAVVAWLRGQEAETLAKAQRSRVHTSLNCTYNLGRSTGYAHAADVIERAAHLPEKDRNDG